MKCIIISIATHSLYNFTDIDFNIVRTIKIIIINEKNSIINEAYWKVIEINLWNFYNSLWNSITITPQLIAIIDLLINTIYAQFN